MTTRLFVWVLGQGHGTLPLLSTHDDTDIDIHKEEPDRSIEDHET